MPSSGRMTHDGVRAGARGQTAAPYSAQSASAKAAAAHAASADWHGHPWEAEQDEAAHRAKCGNNLRQIGLALQNFEAANKTFPSSLRPTPPDPNGLFNGWSVHAQPPAAALV